MYFRAGRGLLAPPLHGTGQEVAIETRPVPYERVTVAALLLVALAVRMAYLADFRHQPLFDGLVLDEANYDAWAQRIAAGDVLGEGTFTANPLEPYVLGLLYALVGRDLLVVRGVQMLASVATCGLLYALTRPSAGPRAALVTLGLAAIYGPFVHVAGNLVAEGWCVLFVAGSLVALTRSVGTRGHALAGALLALAALGRPNLLALVPVLPLARELVLAPHRRFARLAAWGLGVALILGPVAARNADRGGEAVLVTAHGGVNVWIGNNPDADGFFYTPKGSGLAGGQEELITSSIAVASKASGRQLTASEASRWWTRRAFWFAVSRPDAFAALTLRKLQWFLNAYEAPLESNFGWARRESPVLGATIGISLVGPLAIAGLVASRRRWRELAVIYAFVLVYSATVVATFVAMRYRLPVLVGALPFAGIAVDEALRRLASREGRGLAPLVAATLLGAAVFQLPLPEGHAERDLAYHEFLLGNVALDASDWEGARSHYAEAVAQYPPRGTFHYNLGIALLRLDRPAEAVEAFDQAISLGFTERRVYRKLATARSRAEDARNRLGTSDSTGEVP